MKTTTTNIDSISFINYCSTKVSNNFFDGLNTYVQKSNLRVKKSDDNNNTYYNYFFGKHYLFTHKHGFSTNKLGMTREWNLLKFNGLKSYNTTKDNLRDKHLFGLLDYMLKENLKFEIQSIDICNDYKDTYMKNIWGVKKTKGTGKIHKVFLKHNYNKTYYLEDIKTRTNRNICSYTYNKTYKEYSKNNFTIDDDITRFEVKLLPKLLRKINFNNHTKDDLTNEILKQLDNYVVLKSDSTTIIEDKKQYILRKEQYKKCTFKSTHTTFNKKTVVDYIGKLEKYLYLIDDTKIK